MKLLKNEKLKMLNEEHGFGLKPEAIILSLNGHFVGSRSTVYRFALLRLFLFSIAYHENQFTAASCQSSAKRVKSPDVKSGFRYTQQLATYRFALLR
jgi:hypothetical protein